MTEPLLTIEVVPPKQREHHIKCLISKVLCSTFVAFDGGNIVFKFRGDFALPLVTRVSRIPIEHLKAPVSTVETLFSRGAFIRFSDVVRHLSPTKTLKDDALVELTRLFYDLDVARNTFGGVYAPSSENPLMYLCPDYRALADNDYALYRDISNFLDRHIVGSVSAVVQRCVEHDLYEIVPTSLYGDCFSSLSSSDKTEHRDDSANGESDGDFLHEAYDNVFSWYVVTPLFCNIMQSLGEITGQLDNVCVWGRSDYGQRIVSDSVCQAAYVCYSLLNS